MPYGTGPMLRQALLRATPLQRLLLGMAMVGGGAALAVLGHWAGGLLAVAGLVVLWRLGRDRYWPRRPLGGGPAGDGDPPPAQAPVDEP